MGHPVRIDSSDVGTALLHTAREPIVELLALFLMAAPSDEAFAEMAERDPGKWVEAVADMAELVGYGTRPAPRPLRRGRLTRLPGGRR